VAAVVDPAELDEARDDDDPKRAIIALLLRHEFPSVLATYSV
jgi:hypothetical protein